MSLFKNLVLLSSIALFAVSCSDKKEVKEVRKETTVKETVRSTTGATGPIILTPVTPVIAPGTTGR